VNLPILGSAFVTRQTEPRLSTKSPCQLQKLWFLTSMSGVCVAIDPT